MRLINRKACVAIGLTVILTFPVTVVSGAGSQRKGEPHTRCAVTIHEVPVDRSGVALGMQDGPLTSLQTKREASCTHPAL